MEEPTDRGLDRVLLNPKRFMIATILYLRGPSTMSDLQRILDMSWGDLDSSIRRMKKEGYVESKKVITPLGPRTLVRLTRQGYERYRRLLDILEGIISGVKREAEDRRIPE